MVTPVYDPLFSQAELLTIPQGHIVADGCSLDPHTKSCLLWFSTVPTQRTTSHHILLEFSPGSELASVDFLFAFYKDNVESLRMLWSKVTIKLTLCSQDLFEGKKD